ncbi:energy transducer TonB family protein [Asticcacaulis endophyticus]|uniref:TonB C-terminal domain-containing protein n=1 Tax=Asticcacaulis endophyticus TaxID=1395890 RepID=A0A918UTW2_9CAUL|nr:energy transducer TonB [Asticcacaulis endophyticus]GGZ32692.1 hypothetical protein GCM10011273_18600 [Asticcacaulis endophyticus]
MAFDGVRDLIPPSPWAQFEARPKPKQKGLARGVVVSLVLHAAPAAIVVLWGLYSPAPLPVEAPSLAVEMVTLQAPPEPPSEQPDGKRQVEALASKAEPRPIERIVHEVLPSDIEPIPVPPPTPLVTTSVATNPAPATTATAAKPAPPASLAATTPQTWQGQLLSHIEKHKRYPATARGRQGVVQVRFTMDRQGRVLKGSVVRSSGSAALDRAALDTLKRASPLPRPPSEIAGETVELQFDLDFFVR